MATIANDGTRYEVTAPRGTAVVLVHGLGMNRQMWQWQINALASNYRVISYDLYGHGESPLPGTPSLQLFSSQLQQVMDHAGVETAAVLGFSLGGMITRRFAMDHRTRLWALGILHSTHKRDKAAHHSIQARINQSRLQGPQSTVEAALARWFSDSFRANRPDVMGLVRKWVLANSKDIYSDIYQVLVDGVDELVAPIPPIGCPTLVMTAEEDFGNSGEMAHAIAREIPGAATMILPKLRHMALIEAPDIFNKELLSFLTRAERASANG